MELKRRFLNSTQKEKMLFYLTCWKSESEIHIRSSEDLIEMVKIRPSFRLSVKAQRQLRKSLSKRKKVHKCLEELINYLVG